MTDKENVIRLSDLRGAIDINKLAKEESIIKDWMKCISRDNIKKTIIDAETEGRTSAVIIERNSY